MAAETNTLKPAEADKPQFSVHPSLIYQLGESLISDAVQALVELVKNCYDADATYAKVRIDTVGVLEVPDAAYQPTGGRITIEDDGRGMDELALRNGWLLISNRAKRDLKERKETTPGGRTPLGDKGLGRLGAQRLGENMDIFSRVKDGSPFHMDFSWLDFATAPTLGDVVVHLGSCKFPREKGTTVVVSNLKEADAWRGQDPLKRLEQELSRMISPYKAIRDFVVYIEADGKPIELMEVSEKVRELAPVRYSMRFDGETLCVNGKARLEFFRPDSDADEFALSVEADDGKAFYDFLIQNKRAKHLKVSRAEAKDWFVEFKRERKLDDLDGREPDPKNPSLPANPGPFNGEVDSFDLAPGSFRMQSVFDRLKEFRDHIKDLSGIRVYRNGFAIRVDRDWLKLGAQWTSASSYYSLKPDNTLGYIALSARENMALEETTDREGFKDTPYYRNFYALLREFVSFTQEAHEFFRRSWAEFKKAQREHLAKVDSRKSVEVLSAQIRAGLAKVSEQRRSLQGFRGKVEASLKESSSVLRRVTAAPVLTRALKLQMSEAADSLTSLIEEAEKLRGELGTEELDELEQVGKVLDDRVDSLRRQMDDMYETVALGLTAEALSHEIFQIADNLAQRVKAAESRLKGKGDTDRTITTLIETVRSSVMALRKQISYLSPSLKYVREQRHEFSIPTFLEELETHYHERLDRSSIRLIPECPDREAFVVRMNKGKMAQIIDNLILNSEYWLKADIKAGRIREGRISLEVRKPFLRISDNGRGIDPSVEAALFEPFVSAKARGIGRGLGLFITKQLLDSEACSIGVVPERNHSGRLFKFQIDLRGAFNA
jgi:signal transduction histidine kinase